MSIVVWVPLTGLASGLPALTGVASGTPLPANAIAVPEGYDPADPDGLWDLFPTDQEATYAQSYTPIAVATPFNITEAIDGVTLSGGKVQMLTYSLATVATPIEGVTLSGGDIVPTVLIELPVVVSVVAPLVPTVMAPADGVVMLPAAIAHVTTIEPEVLPLPANIILLPAAEVIVDSVSPEVETISAEVILPAVVSTIGTEAPEVIGSAIVDCPAINVVIVGVVPEVVATSTPVQWTLVGRGATTVSTGSNPAPEIPAGVQSGDLLVCIIAARSNPTFTQPSGWTLATSQSNGTTTVGTGEDSIGSGALAWIVRGASDPATEWGLSSTNVSQSAIFAYRPDSGSVQHVASSSRTMAAAGTVVTTEGLTTSGVDNLVIAAVCGGDNNTGGDFSATNPATVSGSVNIATAPTRDTWIKRLTATTSTGADTCLHVADGVRETGGDTGEIQAVITGSARHVMVAAVFKAAP